MKNSLVIDLNGYAKLINSDHNFMVQMLIAGDWLAGYC
ncbi:MAG: hypothetical protein ACJAXN_000778 [Psychromonas sp.]|jgi:hypothetical protein